MSSTILKVTHEVSFPTNGDETGQIMVWCEEQNILYSFSRGSYIMKLSDEEWMEFMDWLIEEDKGIEIE